MKIVKQIVITEEEIRKKYANYINDMFEEFLETVKGSKNDIIDNYFKDNREELSKLFLNLLDNTPILGNIPDHQDDWIEEIKNNPCIFFTPVLLEDPELEGITVKFATSSVYTPIEQIDF